MSQAVSICEKDGSKPPLPKNFQENSDILDYFQKQREIAKAMTTQYVNEYFVLDLNDVKLEGTFVSSTGFKPSFTNWYGNEPDNGFLDQDYVAMYTDGKWRDYQFIMYFSIICQQECNSKKAQPVSKLKTAEGKTSFLLRSLQSFVILNFKKPVPANLVTRRLSLIARNDVSNSIKACLSYRKQFQYAPKTGQSYHFQRTPKKTRISYLFSKPNRRFQLKTAYIQ